MRYLLALVLAGCVPAEPCIHPPPMKTEQQQTLAAALALQFAQIPVGGSVSANFSATSNAAFEQLSDANAAFFMSLQAIECYMREGKIGQEIALEMSKAVNAKFLSVTAPK